MLSALRERGGTPNGNTMRPSHLKDPGGVWVVAVSSVKTAGEAGCRIGKSGDLADEARGPRRTSQPRTPVERECPRESRVLSTFHDASTVQMKEVNNAEAQRKKGERREERGEKGAFGAVGERGSLQRYLPQDRRGDLRQWDGWAQPGVLPGAQDSDPAIHDRRRSSPYSDKKARLPGRFPVCRRGGWKK